MRPVCCECRCEMQCYKNGCIVQVADNYYYSGDQWKCPHCERKIVSGFGQSFHKLSTAEKVIDIRKGQEGKTT